MEKRPRNRFREIDTLASKSALKLSERLGDISLNDMAMYLALVSVRGIQSSEDAKALVQQYTISFNSVFNAVVKSKSSKGESESLPS